MSGIDGRRTAPVASAEEERDRLIAVLQAQGELQDLYIRNGADRAWWDAALRRVIALSGSQFGFLGRIEHEVLCEAVKGECTTFHFILLT